jgi:GTP-binding protein HflX
VTTFPPESRSDLPERAVLVAVLRPDADPGELAEMRELLRTAGAEVVGEIVQHRSAPDAKTYIGSGKVDELRARCKELQAEVVVCEDDLSPNQQRRLEDTLEMRVVDRTRVILDIFALHAHSAEGKLQVELAQLEYNMQRMRGMWKHLERLGGGVGTRGPGESQLETDRRLARDRVALLKRRLKRVRAHRETLRKRRDRASLPGVALAGYTNVGKSTLLNALTGSTVSAADRLFHTLDPTTRAYDHLGRTYVVTDTVGFIRKLPHHLVASFRATLEETNEADLVLHVIDASSAAWEEQRVVVEQVLDELGATDRPKLIVFNKIDLLPEAELLALQERVSALIPSAIYVSTVSEGGLEPLRRALEAATRTRRPVTKIRVSVSDGRTLAEIHQSGEVLDQQVDGEWMVVTARVDDVLAGRLRKAGATVSSAA